MLPILPAKKSVERRHQLPLRFEGHLLFIVCFAGLPAVILSLVLLWRTGYSLDHKIELSFLVVAIWSGLGLSARAYVVHSLQVLSNVISAVRDEDFSFRATQAHPGDALGELALEINGVSRALAEERLSAIDTSNLLRKVMAEAGTVIFAFSLDDRLKIVNHVGTRFLGQREEAVLNRTAAELGIADLLEGPPTEVVSRAGFGTNKRWIVRRGNFRQRGEPQRLIILSEASEALRAEERLAWQKLIRVLSHEINNSLAPIRSIAHTLGRISGNAELPMPLSQHLAHGLEVIRDRADFLNRFLQSYTRLAKMPVPARRKVALEQLISRVASLESRLSVNVAPGPPVHINVDPDQLEQALINLIKNAADSVLLSPGHVSPTAITIEWNVHASDLEIRVLDEGIGLTDTENLFIPFYTTKQTGTGVGLLITRQIIEAHQGTLLLRNRENTIGCHVEVRLPKCVAPRDEWTSSTESAYRASNP
ncbi:MAG TPA: ATP-binding protein [Candidatus Acidoferrales bacterium]|jgi:two-component system nitrogen regulation sensor histidine kinase NtrY|nr:ATP-binding protein [Candidatus Acidoferrales bacterium]